MATDSKHGVLTRFFDASAAAAPVVEPRREVESTFDHEAWDDDEQWDVTDLLWLLPLTMAIVVLIGVAVVSAFI